MFAYSGGTGEGPREAVVTTGRKLHKGDAPDSILRKELNCRGATETRASREYDGTSQRC